MSKAVIFDLDGVIVDTAKFHYQGWKRLADELGVPFDEQANEKLRGVPRRESLLALLGRNPGEKKIQEYSGRKNAHYLELVATLKPGDLLPGVQALLTGLRQAGFKLALASSSQNARLVLDKVGMTAAFDAVVDGNEIKHGKPDPELFVLAGRRLKVEPKSCLVVEDAESGIVAGIAAGMHTLGVGPLAALTRAERVVSSLAEIDVAAISALLQGLPAPGRDARHPGQGVPEDPAWFVTEDGFNQQRQALQESLFTLGNGYLGVRGSVEEYDLPFPDSRPGTFVSGVFDVYDGWYQAIVNLPFPFATRFTLNGQRLSLTAGKFLRYRRLLDMYRGLLIRTFVWEDAQGLQTEFEFQRLVSMSDLRLAALRVTFKPLNWSGAAVIDNLLDANVDNIDFHKSGYQLRRERYHFVDFEEHGALADDGAHTIIRTKTNPHRVATAVRLAVRAQGQLLQPAARLVRGEKTVSRELTIAVQAGQEYRLEKMIGFAAARDGFEGQALLQAADATALAGQARGFGRVAEDHCTAWRRRWRLGDVAIEGHARDQQAMRFALFHLNQFVNPNDPKVNIGSRGLTAEMHYGNCFWDTELFIIPYYIYTWPEAARALLEYRYQTLPEARNKAERLFFKGAMFPWMSSYPGKEQADYWEYANIAVHIVSDVNYALQHYARVTGDDGFIDAYGAEVVFETARFWQSRAYYNPRRKKYCINTVKGPNEYDGVVNNNTYTNFSARYNLQCGVALAAVLRTRNPKVWSALAKKIKLAPAEVQAWAKTAKGMFINYDKAKRLYIEDDFFLDKEPCELKRLKPGKKIITELGVSWDTLLRLQIVKQADVLLLMSLFPDEFTRAEKLAAWKFYEPKTCHDSSLSFNTHSIMAAQLDMPDKAIDYWDRTARLDLDDMMENSFLGVHSASVGGTWQIAVLGFAGMRVRPDGFAFNPKLPRRWRKLEFPLRHRGRLLWVSLGKKQGRLSLAATAPSGLAVTVGKKRYALQPGQEVSITW